ncbi:Choline transporter-like protein 2 [Armadillidium nasatum]|uniref:Choline transporter-like protein n=1 Tax=Armadillidium nasatum TaxID=96803 RepID=A0A5N5TFZ4_9CRUS|nr:Choline transporter-like protein 2 [Armadillidium nasatum]
MATNKVDPLFVPRSDLAQDIICLILFILFLIGWAIIAALAVTYGDPGRLINPTDSIGQVCGRDLAVRNKPYLFFFDLTRCASPKVPFTGCPTPQICVEHCPTENWFYLPGSSNDKSKLYCKEGVNKSKPISDLILTQGLCWLIMFTVRALLDSIVWQSQNLSNEEKFDIVTDGLKYVARFVRFQEMSKGLHAEVKLKKFIKFLPGKDLLKSVFVGRCIPKVNINVTVVNKDGVTLKLPDGSEISSDQIFKSMNMYGEFLKARKAKNHIEEDKMMTQSEKEFVKTFSSVSDVQTTWLVFFIITVSLFIICLFILIFLRKRVKLAIALINEASKALGHMMSAVFFPLLPYLMHIVLLLIFCVIAVLIASAGKPIYRVVCNGDCSCSSLPENSTCSPTSFSTNCTKNEAICQFISYDVPSYMSKLHIYNVFAVIWTMLFVSAFCEYVLAGAFASYYWSFNKPADIPATPVIRSLWRTCRYHLGTIAFGSLIIAIVRFIRLIFEYIDHKIKKYADNFVVKMISCCFRCCLWCLEKFLKFINRNAYIYSAIYGTNFCTSARKAFSLLMRNIIRVVVLDKVTDFLLLIGKLVVTGTMALLSFGFFSGEIIDLRGHLPPMNYYLTPVIIITIATFFIASAFFDVYNMAVDTLFYCFLEDSERNDGSREKPYYMSKELKKILHKKNKDE